MMIDDDDVLWLEDENFIIASVELWKIELVLEHF